MRLRCQDGPERRFRRSGRLVRWPVRRGAWCRAALLAALAASFVGCRAQDHRHRSDQAAYDIITEKRLASLGRDEPFTIETPAETLRRRLMLDQQLPFSTEASLGSKDVEPIKQWPDDEYLERPDTGDELVDALATDDVLTISLTDALQIAAHESREYQVEKESVFETALQLDLQRDDFRRTWTGVIEGKYQVDLEQEVALDDKGHTDRQPVGGLEYGGILGFSQKLRNGLSFTAQIGLDLVGLLTQDRAFSRGVYADASISIPLMRGAGEFVVTEPLTQAERNVVYAIYEFERFKRQFVVSIADEYLSVLRQLDSVQNARDNYEQLIIVTRRARSLAEAGELSEIDVDQSRQNELRARNQWISALEAYKRQLDSFKLTLGLPADAEIELQREELDTIRQSHSDLIAPLQTSDEGEVPPADAAVEFPPPGQGDPGPLELDRDVALRVALENRLDLRVAIGKIFDTQRKVAVAADQLRADVTLLGSGAAGAQRSLASVHQDDSILRPDEGSYSVLLTLDLPFERTRERVTYRGTLIDFEAAVRNVQASEDQIKLEISNGLSRLLEGRESILIQAQAVKVARRRVESTREFLEAGRAEIRDVLEAQDALVTAQNALTSALINYRVNELALQRDLGVLIVDHRGLWQEYDPAAEDD